MIPKPDATALTFGSESHILNRMTWNEAFRGYIERRFGENPQQQAAFSLKATPSNISYWCRDGRIPRQKWRDRIDKWSGGEVPSELQVGFKKAQRRSAPPQAKSA